MAILLNLVKWMLARTPMNAGSVKNNPLWQLHSVLSLGHIVCYISFSKYVHISAKHFH